MFPKTVKKMHFLVSLGITDTYILIRFWEKMTADLSSVRLINST